MVGTGVENDSLKEKPLVEVVGDKTIVRLLDPSHVISRMHIELYKKDGDWFLKDLGSLNGSAVLTEVWLDSHSQRISRRRYFRKIEWQWNLRAWIQTWPRPVPNCNFHATLVSLETATWYAITAIVMLSWPPREFAISVSLVVIDLGFAFLLHASRIS